MTRTWYLPPFEKELTGSACEHANCNMAAAAMAAQQVSLGAIQTGPDELRTLSGTAWECVDNDKTNDGTNIEDAVTALARKGVTLTTFDATDGKHLGDLLAYLKKGRFAIVHGDYDQVPTKLRGDKDFFGLHSVYFQEYRASVPLYNGTKGPGIRVGDPLNDGRAPGVPLSYIWWPTAVAQAYAEKFPGTGLTFGIIDLRTLKARVPVANIRAKATTSSTIIGRLKPADKALVWGAVQIGGAVGANRRWYRVWVPSLAKIGFMHSSVVSASVDTAL